MRAGVHLLELRRTGHHVYIGHHFEANIVQECLRDLNFKNISFVCLSHHQQRRPLNRVWFTTGSDTSCDDSLSVLICFLSYITNHRRLSPQLVEMKFYLGQTLGFLPERVCRCRSVILGRNDSRRDPVCLWMSMNRSASLFRNWIHIYSRFQRCHSR